MTTRQKVLHLIYEDGGCHIGSCFSCIEMVEAIYEIIGPTDKFIFSKSHASKVVDALGHIPQYVEKLHCNGGALGNGYGIGLGMALADPASKVYVVIGDGEFEEGSTWEAYNFHKRNRVSNLYVLVDNNGWQGLKSSKLMLRYSDQWVQFLDSVFPSSNGWEPDMGRFKRNLIDELTCRTLISRVFVCNTIKGYGIKELEDTLGSHYRRMSESDYQKWMGELHA